MGIIYDCRDIPRSPQVFQTAGSRFQGAEGQQGGGWLGAEHHGRGVYCQQVVGIVFSYQPYPYLFAVDVEEHSVEALLQHPALVVGDALAGVADHSGLAVLYHYPSVAVVHIYDCPGVLRQAVEEQLLAAQVFGEALVVIQMVVREVGENAHVEVQGGRSLLLYPYGADLHEAVAAALLHHLGHQGVDRDRVGGGVHGLAAFIVHIVGYGGKQAAAVPQCLEHPVEQGHGRSLAVCARDAH